MAATYRSSRAWRMCAQASDQLIGARQIATPTMIPAATTDRSVRRLRRRAGGVIAPESTAGCITAGLGGTEDNGTIGSRAAPAASVSGGPPPADAAHQRPALLRG